MKINIKSYVKYLFCLVLVSSIVCALVFNFIFYPLKYKQEIITYAEIYQVNTSLIASVICNESSFDTNIKSPKGAIGLMQLMPNTAEWLCEKLGEPYDENKLYQPEFNIKLGTYYINYLSKKFKNIDTVIVAYNAGEGVVQSWLQQAKYSSDGETLKSIPYPETSIYLSKVKRTIKFYQDRI